jgi:hypothetical protein
MAVLALHEEKENVYQKALKALIFLRGGMCKIEFVRYLSSL